MVMTVRHITATISTERRADAGTVRLGQRARNAELHDQHTRTQAGLAALRTAAPQAVDLTLLDGIPALAGLFDQAPEDIREAIYEAFDIQVLYRDQTRQATITDATPQAITGLLTDHDARPGTPAPAAPATGTCAGLAPAPVAGETTHNHGVLAPGRLPLRRFLRSAIVRRGVTRSLFRFRLG